jgi:hypothetical protein
MKGMIVDIYKNNGGDCSNGGLSSKANRCLLVGGGIPEIFDGEGMPVVTIVKRDLRDSIYLTAYPVKEDGHIDTGCMHGGCFVYSSDSRFRNLAAYPVPLHDRKE